MSCIGALFCVATACHKAPPDENVRALQGSNGVAAVGGGSTAGTFAGGTSGKGGGGGGSGKGGGGGGPKDAGPVLHNDAGEVIVVLPDGAVKVIDASIELDAGVDASLPPPPPFSKSALLEAFASCAMERYEDFVDDAAHLSTAANALAANPNDTTLAAAQGAWLAAIATWQRAELFRYGPAARSMNPGGQDLRDQIYIFPLANACKVDQQIVDKTYASDGFATSLGSARGLTALEYLLFHTGSNNSCLSAININKSGTWAALGETELRKRRADYAEAAAAQVKARANALVNAWDPAHGDFEAKLTNPGSGSPYATEQDAFNAVSDALFYVEIEVKDWKLGWPLGLVPDCINAPGTCPTAVESRYAHASTDHLRQNLIAARKLFEGCGDQYYGLGFDDWLVAVGDEALASDMLTALRGAQQAVEDLDPLIEQAIVLDPSKVAIVHTAVKAFTDLLKGDLVTVLNLDLPQGAEGDND